MARRMPLMLMRVGAGGAGFGLVIGAFKGLIEGSWAVFAILAGVFALVPIVALALGGLLAMGVPPWLRRAWIGCWVRSVWRVHIPWLWAPLVIPVAAAGRIVPGLIPVSVCIGIPLLFIFWVAVWEPFSQAWMQSCSSCGLVRHRSIGYFAAIPSYIASLPLALLMLAVAAS